MPKRSSTDPNELGAQAVAKLTGQNKEGKLRAAVELGRLGGLKGGKARARKLSAKRRRQIAVIAARKRWQENKQHQ